MQLTAAIRFFAGLSMFCLVTGNSVSAQPSAIPPVNKEVILKGGYQAVKDTSEEGVLIVTKDSVYDVPASSVPVTNPSLPNIPAGKYYKANLLHYKMIDSLVRVIAEFPVHDSAGLKYADDFVGTVNMGLRRPNYVIIHHTASNGFEEVLQEFTKPGGREASSHYVICKDGTVYHMLNDLLRSHHAGDSKWGNTTDLNSSSIGIELVNNGKEAYTDEQMSSLLTLLQRLKNQYKIPDANFIGHGDIAPTRKADPSRLFPWQVLSENGFGLWWSDTTNVVVPATFDYMMALRIVGYDISSPSSAIAAFRRHFMGDSKGVMTPEAIRILFTLYRKFE